MRSISISALLLYSTAQAQPALTFPLENPGSQLVHGWHYSRYPCRSEPDGFCGNRHFAIDYRTQRGESILASCDGVAIATESWSDARGVGAYGHFVLHRCAGSGDDPLMIIYAHLEQAHQNLARRDRYDREYESWTPVRQGEIIGFAGSSGTSWAHLHLQIFQGHYGDHARRSIDPYGVYSVAQEYPGNCLNTLWLRCPPLPPALVDFDGDGWSMADGDCLDEGETLEGISASAIHPGAEEFCNYTDDNCDGAIDEGFEEVGETCSVGLGACRREGRVGCTVAQDDVACSISEPWPASDEVCDRIDNDCDGEVDNGVLNACGSCGAVPEEVCNGLDDDCDEIIDDGVCLCGNGICEYVPEVFSYEVCATCPWDCDDCGGEGEGEGEHWCRGNCGGARNIDGWICSCYEDSILWPPCPDACEECGVECW